MDTDTKKTDDINLDQNNEIMLVQAMSAHSPISSPKAKDTSNTRIATTMMENGHINKKGARIPSLQFIMNVAVIVLLLCIFCVLIALLVKIDSNLNVSITTSDDTTNTADDSDNTCEDDYSCYDSVEKQTIELSFGESTNNKLRTYQSPNEVLPGIQFFTYSYNLLQGKTPMDLLFDGGYRQIFDITFDNNKVATGSVAYLVPDQLDLPGITAVCATQSQKTSLASSTSTSTMFNEAKENTQTSTMKATVKANGFGFSASASHSTSLTHSRSSSVTKGLEYAQSGKTVSQTKISKAILYSTRIRWDSFNTDNSNCDSEDGNGDVTCFNDDFLNDIKNIKDEIDSVVFFGTWGTHVLAMGVLGSRCRESTYFEESFSSESYEYSSEYTTSNDNSYETSVSGGGEGDGFGASVDVAFSKSSENKYSTTRSKNGEETYTAEYSTETIACMGEIYITSQCGEMFGRQTEPALVGYNLKPIFEIEALYSNYTNQMDTLKSTINNIIEHSISLCDGIGIPAANLDFWETEDYVTWNNSDRGNNNYSAFWDDSICFDQFMIGLTMLNISYDTDDSDNSSSNSYNNPFSQDLQYDRREYSEIKYAALCEESKDVDISFTLQMIPGTVQFAINLGHKQDYSFTSFFWIVAGESTDFGAANYFLLCNDVAKWIYSNTYSIPFDNNSLGNYSRELVKIDLNDDLAANCGTDYNVVVGFHSVGTLNDNGAMQVTVPKDNKTDAYYHLDVRHVDYNAKGYNITMITHCNTNRIIVSDTYSFTYSDFITDTAAFANEATNTIGGLVGKKFIEYSPVVDCNHVKIWTGFSAVHNPCNMAVWTEGVLINSFELVMSIWRSNGSVCGSTDDKHFTNSSKVVASVDYIAFCSG
ncbi:MAC/perforin domain-containing protein [bacterium]|nr:MAC/perforin domain-containing protein [bacterium]